MELARYACTNAAASKAIINRPRGKLPFLPGHPVRFLVPSTPPPSFPSAAAFRRFLSRRFFSRSRLSIVVLLHRQPELALASRGSSQRGWFGDGAILPGQSNRAIVATNHPNPPSQPTRTSPRPSLPRGPRVHCTRVVLTYLRHIPSQL